MWPELVRGEQLPECAICVEGLQGGAGSAIQITRTLISSQVQKRSDFCAFSYCTVSDGGGGGVEVYFPIWRSKAEGFGRKVAHCLLPAPVTGQSEPRRHSFLNGYTAEERLALPQARGVATFGLGCVCLAESCDLLLSDLTESLSWELLF